MLVLVAKTGLSGNRIDTDLEFRPALACVLFSPYSHADGAMPSPV